MESRILYRNSDGVRRTMLVDHERPDQFTVHTEVEAEAILESIRRAREEVVPGSVNKFLARIPLTVYEQSIIEQWDDADWKKWLNDPDNAAFRVWQGRA